MGRREFETVVAQSPKVEMKKYVRIIPPGLASMAISVITIKSEPNTFAEVVGGFFECIKPTGAVSGTHTLACRMVIDETNGFYDGLFMNTAYNVSATWRNRFINADSPHAELNGFTLHTTPPSMQDTVLKKLVFDDTSGLELRYENLTNVATSGYTYLVVYYKETEVR